MKTIFFGASQFVIPLLAYTQTHTDLAFVITTEEKPTDAIPSFCQKHALPYKGVRTLKDSQLIKEIQETKPMVGILAYFGLILPQPFLDLFPKGIINIHPSLLPKYRGPTPGQQALLHGDKQTGVSIMILDKEVDHGPLLGQEQELIEPHDTSVTLYTRLFTKGTKLLATVLEPYVSGKLQTTPQDHTKATFTPSLTRQSGFVAGENLPDPHILDRMIRAYFPWPGVWTICPLPTPNLHKKVIKFLPENKVQVEGKKPMSVKDFINGYPTAKEWIEKFIL